MAQNIQIAGVSFPDVPRIDVPITGTNNFAQFFDTSDADATASDVLAGKIFYNALGKVIGTGSGGGAANIKQGTFTTGATAGAASFDTGYSGSGYPIALMIYVDGGAYNNSESGNTTWYNSKTRYDCGWYTMIKARTTTEPTYTNTENSSGTVALIYKNSTTSATTYTSLMSVTVQTYINSSSSAQAGSGCAKFKGNGHTVSYFVGNATSSTIGFPKNTKMAYIAIYSA